MATAEELLSGVPAGDKILVISNDLRTINIPSGVTNLGVESDDDVLRLQFKMPRYISDTDLSTFGIRINYINAKGEDDAYTVKDATIGSQYITFSWLVGPLATAYKGNTKFNVCMVTLKSAVNEDGETVQVIDKEYNTTVATLPVLEGLEVDERIVSEYPDLLEQWRRELFGIGDTEEANMRAVSQAEQEAIVNKGAEVLSTIPADYATAVSMTDNADRTKADAIICSRQGEIISVADSSDDYLRGLRVFGKSTQISTTGKNLLNLEETVTLSNVKGISVSLDAGTYIVSIASETHSGDQQPYLRFYENNVWIQLKNGLAQSAVLSQPETTVYLYTYGMSASESDGVTATLNRLMVSTSGGTYEPYSGGFASPSPDWPQELANIENPTVNIYGSNLLTDYTDYKSTLRGITCEFEGDGVYHIYGTFNGTVQSLQFADIALNIPIDRNVKYTLSCELVDGTPPDDFHPYIGLSSDTVSHRNWLALNVDGKCKIGDIVNNTLTPADTLSNATHINRFWIYAYNDTLDTYTADFRIRVWLTKSDVPMPYEPYTKQKITSANTIHGIPVDSGGNYTDANGQQWICDEVDFERGVYIQRLKTRTLDGTEGWSYFNANNGVNQFYTIANDSYSDSISVNAASSHLRGISLSKRSYNYNTVYTAAQSTNNFICVNIKEYTSVAEFTAFLEETPITVLYRLKEPIETPLTAEEIEWFHFSHTNFPNTTVLNDAGATMELKYNADTKTYLDNCFRPTDEQVQAAVDAWLTAHYSSAEGVSF